METRNEQRVGNFKELLVWQKAMALASAVYSLTGRFPSAERFGLVAQMRRAAVSVPSNIAEGQARNTTGEFVQFISHAEGSLAELETQLRLSLDLNLCGAQNAAPLLHMIEEERKMLNALRRSLLARHSSLVTRH
jgi:four helix bundle protein